MVQAVEGMNSLLAVSWTMPPIVLPRSIQIARTLKALGPLGWQSEVISTTVASNVGANIDEEFAKLYLGAYRQHYIEHRESVAASSAWRRLQRRYRPPANLDEANWIERSTRYIIQQCKQRKCDILVTFAQPWIDHSIGLEVRRRRHVPWLAHFSDPWVDSLYYDSSVAEIASKLEVWREQERKIIETADIVVFVTQQTADLVMRKYPPLLSRKVRVVPHGFDRDTLTSPAVVNSLAELRVMYTGNIYAGTRHPVYLFEAVAEMNARSPLAGRLRLDFYGHCPPEVAAKVTELGIGSIVTFHGTVGYLDSLRYAAEADLLLLIDAPSDLSVFLPSKIVDYLMLKKPILALTPSEGASRDVLSPLGHFVVAPTDKSAMIDTLTGIIARHGQGQPLATLKDDVDAFDIKQTTRLFDKALRDAMAVSKQR
ncbi:glycosyltransferase [Bradyrhizobium sp. AUGA SZCCT0182]|nr:glycosyltransferase [Bradyrhizobium sp. AUGA SZCCT0182]